MELGAVGLVAVGLSFGFPALNRHTTSKTEKGLDVKYETAKNLPVKRWDVIPLCADGPSGTACYVKITDINEKGIELRFFGEVFQDKSTTQTVNLDYGRGVTFNAGTRIDAINAKKSDRPDEAKVTVTSMPRSKTE